MKRIDLGQTIAILANLGVIAGIVFLALELRQNNELLTAQTSYSLFNVERERRRMLIENAGGIFDIAFKASTGDELSDIDRARLRIANADVMNTFRWQFRELQAGRLPDDDIDVSLWRGIWNSAPGLAEQFQAQKAGLDPEFVEFVEENFVNR